MYQLYGFTGSASLAPRMVLEELKLPYQFIRLDADKGEHRTADYLKLNPNGRVPTLVDDEQVLYEAAAICLYLCDKEVCDKQSSDKQPGGQRAASRLAPPITAPARGQLYKWLMFLTNTLQPALVAYFYPDRLSTEVGHAPAIKARAEQTAQQIYEQLDRELAQQGPYLLGSELSVADLYLLMLVRWGRWFAEPPVTRYPQLARLVELVSARPAVQATFAAEGIPAPYCLLPKA